MSDENISRSTPARLLIIEDDVGVLRLLRTLFEGEGYRVSEARTGEQARSELARGDVALMTLDLGLGGEDGLALARDIRRIYDAPIIMITAKAGDVDRIVGLELGADDYIVKPFNTREVLARVRAVLRRTRMTAAAHRVADGRFAFDGFVFDIPARVLTRRDGKVVALTAREFDMLEAFVRRPRRALTRDALLDLVGADRSEPLDRAIDTLVSRLRRKIETDTAKPVLIQTVRGAGYLFAAKVTPA